MPYVIKPEIPESNTSAVCAELSILPEALSKWVKADLFRLPTQISQYGRWRVWSDEGTERLRELVERKAGRIVG